MDNSDRNNDPAGRNGSVITDDITTLPWKQLCCAILCQVALAATEYVPFAFTAYLVADNGKTGENLAITTGRLIGSYYLAQLVGALLWGFLGDSWGRKPVLLIGILGSAMGSIIFGLSNGSLNQAFLGRIVTGFFASNQGLLKSFLREVCDDTNCSRALSYFSIAGIIGTALSQLITAVCMEYSVRKSVLSHLSHSSHLKYFLPCAATALLNFIVVVVCSIFMQESLHISTAKRRRNFSSILKDGRERTNDSSIYSYRQIDWFERHIETNGIEFTRINSGSNDVVNELLLDLEISRQDGHEVTEEIKDDPLVASVTSLALQDLSASSGELKPVSYYFSSSTTRLVWINYTLLVTSTAVVDTASQLLLQLPCSKSELGSGSDTGSNNDHPGGLGMSVRATGYALTLAGIANFFFSVTILPKLAQQVCKKTMYNQGIVFLIPGSVSWYLISWMVRSLWIACDVELVFWLVVCASAWKNMAAVVSYTACFVQIVNAVPSAHLGKMTGISQSAASLVRGFSPFLAGQLFAASLKHHLLFMIFIVISGLLICSVCFNNVLPSSINYAHGAAPVQQSSSSSQLYVPVSPQQSPLSPIHSHPTQSLDQESESYETESTQKFSSKK